VHDNVHCNLALNCVQKNLVASRRMHLKHPTLPAVVVCMLLQTMHTHLLVQQVHLKIFPYLVLVDFNGVAPGGGSKTVICRTKLFSARIPFQREVKLLLEQKHIRDAHCCNAFANAVWLILRAQLHPTLHFAQPHLQAQIEQARPLVSSGILRLLCSFASIHAKLQQLLVAAALVVPFGSHALDNDRHRHQTILCPHCPMPAMPDASTARCPHKTMPAQDDVLPTPEMPVALVQFFQSFFDGT